MSRSSRWTLVLAALAVSLAAGCRSDQERFEDHMARADAYVEEGAGRTALLELRSALQLEPESAEVNFRIANVALALERPTDAIFYFRETQRLDPTRLDAAMGEATLVLWQDPELADKLISAAIERDPDFAAAYGVKVDLELKRGNLDAALEAALTTIELEPDAAAWNQKLGLAYAARIRLDRSQGKEIPDARFAQAADAFERAFELYAEEREGGGWRALFQRARIIAAWPGHEDEIDDAFRQAGDAPSEVGVRRQALNTIATWTETAGNTALRRWALEELTGLEGGALRPWVELARLEHAAGVDPSPVYERLVESRSEDPEAHLLYARYRAGPGEDTEGSLAYLRNLVERGVEPPVILAGMLDILYQLDRSDEAKEIYEELLRGYPQHPSARLARAQRALGERRFDDAAVELHGMTDVNESVSALRLLAQAEHGRGNTEQALGALERAIALAGANPRLLAQKARLQQTAGDWRGLLATLRAIARQWGLAPGQRLMAARAHYELGHPALGRRILEELLEGEEPPPGAAILFSTRESENDPEAARQVLAKMAARFPKDPRLVYEQVRIDLLVGSSDEALIRINAFLEESGSATPTLLLARARLHAARGDVVLARQDALRVFEVAPNLGGVLPLLVRLYEQEDDLESAIASFEEADAAGALSPASRMLLARLYLRVGRDADALPLLEAVVEARDDLATAKNDLAYLLARSGGDLDRALALAQEAQQVLSSDPAAIDTLGYVYLLKQLPVPALEQFRYALELATAGGEPLPEYEYHRGLALRALGRERDAVSAFESAIALDPEFGEAASAREELEAARAALADRDTATSSS